MQLPVYGLHSRIFTTTEGDVIVKTREELQASMEAGIAASEEKIAALKVKMADAGADASEEGAAALAKAEKLCEDGKSKLAELAAASDESFENLRASAEENWDSISAQLDEGWTSVSDKVKSFFS